MDSTFVSDNPKFLIYLSLTPFPFGNHKLDFYVYASISFFFVVVHLKKFLFGI